MDFFYINGAIFEVMLIVYSNNLITFAENISVYTYSNLILE